MIDIIQRFGNNRFFDFQTSQNYGTVPESGCPYTYTVYILLRAIFIISIYSCRRLSPARVLKLLATSVVVDTVIINLSILSET